MPEMKAFHGVHPGVVLKEELAARGLSATAFGLRLRVPPQRIQEIVAGRRAITPETALRIGRALGDGCAVVARDAAGLRSVGGGTRAWRAHPQRGRD